MAIKLSNTRGLAADGVKIWTYGAAGSGKTTLIHTLPSPVVISAEGGLLSLADYDIPYIEIRTLTQLGEVFEWLEGSEDAKAFKSIALDSVTEVGDVVLDAELKDNKDGRKAYGKLAQKMRGLIRAFRDLPGKHVYFSAELDKFEDEQGRVFYGPAMPGKQLVRKAHYVADFLFALRVERDSEGNTHRALLCDSDGLWAAKNRGGKLEQWEAPDLGAIIRKIGGDCENA